MSSEKRMTICQAERDLRRNSPVTPSSQAARPRAEKVNFWHLEAGPSYPSLWYVIMAA